MYKKTTVCAKWYIPCIFSFVKTVCKMQSIVSRPFFVYGGCCLFVGVALLPLSATGGGRQATPTDCTNHYIFTVGHNMFFYITNCLHEQGKAARRITNKKVGKQKFCIENLLPDFNF